MFLYLGLVYPETRRPRNPETQKPGNPNKETQKPGNPETRKPSHVLRVMAAKTVLSDILHNNNITRYKFLVKKRNLMSLDIAKTEVNIHNSCHDAVTILFLFWGRFRLCFILMLCHDLFN